MLERQRKARVKTSLNIIPMILKDREDEGDSDVCSSDLTWIKFDLDSR